MARMIYHAATDKPPKTTRINKPRKRTKKLDIKEREFAYSYFHVNAWALRDLLNAISPVQIKTLFDLCMITKQNSNMLMNTFGEPATTKEEISSALGMSGFGASLTVLKNNDIIRKDGKEYYLNPYVISFGRIVDDYTYEIFTDSKWRLYCKSTNYGEAELP